MRLLEESCWGTSATGLLPFLADHVGPAELVVGTGVDRATYPFAARSHLSDGRAVAWTAPSPRGCRLAVDAELLGQRVPPVLLRRAGVAADLPERDVWRQWTRAETVAKLLDVPILLWVREHGLTVPAGAGDEAPLALRTVEHAGLVVTMGIRGPHP